MSDNIKEITDICKSVSACYMLLLTQEIGYAKVLKCLDEKDFGSLSDDELLSVKDVSEFIMRTIMREVDSFNSLTEKCDEWAHALAIAVVICKELNKRGLLTDELGQLKNVVIKER